MPTGAKVGSRLSSAPTALFASAACDAPAVGLRSAELQLGSLKVSTRRREAKIAHRGGGDQSSQRAAGATECSAPPYSYTRRRPSPRTRAAAASPLDSASADAWRELLPTGLFYEGHDEPHNLEKDGVPCTVPDVAKLENTIGASCQEIMVQAWAGPSTPTSSAFFELLDVARALPTIW